LSAHLRDKQATASVYGQNTAANKAVANSWGTGYKHNQDEVRRAKSLLIIMFALGPDSIATQHF